MAFAPRGSKGPGRSPYRTALSSSHTPNRRAKMSLSFDNVQTPQGKTVDDACSVRSSCGSDSRTTFRPSGTAWKSDELLSPGSQACGSSEALSGIHDSCSGMYQIRENTSYMQNAGLVTPALKEGQRFGMAMQDCSPLGITGVSASSRSSDKMVQLSPAACKRLNEVAAHLWIIAYHQQYMPTQVDAATAKDVNTVQHLTQAALMHIINTGVKTGRNRSHVERSAAVARQKKIVAGCLFLLVLVSVCVMSFNNSYASMDYS